MITPIRVRILGGRVMANMEFFLAKSVYYALLIKRYMGEVLLMKVHHILSLLWKSQATTKVFVFSRKLPQ